MLLNKHLCAMMAYLILFTSVVGCGPNDEINVNGSNYSWSFDELASVYAGAQHSAEIYIRTHADPNQKKLNTEIPELSADMFVLVKELAPLAKRFAKILDREARWTDSRDKALLLIEAEAKYNSRVRSALNKMKVVSSDIGKQVTIGMNDLEDEPPVVQA